MIKYFQILDSRRRVSPLRAKCIKSLRENIGDNEYKVIEVEYSENVFEMIARVDRKKLDIAATVPEACIVDTDCFIATPIHMFDEIVPGVPYFAKYEYNTAMISPDICYFYVNGACDYFKTNLPVSTITEKHYSLSPEVLKGLSGFNFIPPMSYFHYYESMTAVDRLVSNNEMSAELKAARLQIALFEKGIEQLAIAVKIGRENGTIRK